MTSRSFTTLGLSALALLFAGCGGEPSQETGEPAPRRQFVTIGSAPVGGVFFSMGGAIADIINQHSGRNWQASAEASGGTMENIRRLDQGDMQLALAASSISYFAVRGEEGWEKAYPVKSVMTLYPNVGLFVTLANSTVKSIPDFKGKRIVCGPEGGGMEYFLRPMFAAHGLAFEEINAVYASQQAGMEYLGDGAVDAALIAGGIPVPALVGAATTLNLHFVPFDEAAIANLIAQYPFYQEATIPPGIYTGQSEAFPALNVGSAQLLCADSADEEFIYHVTKTLYENRERMAEIHPSAKSITPENAPRFVGVEFHPGAIRYYRESGIWPDEAAAP